MSALFLSFAIACALSTTMLAAGTRIGRQRTVGELSQLLERGTFRLLSAEGKPVSVGELSDALGTVPPSPTVAPSKLIALALTVASVSGVPAYFIVRSGH